MIIYRLATEQYIEDLSGTGAKLFGGRWNTAGMPALYATENISLALVEILVRTDKTLMPPDYMLLKLEIPDQLVLATIQQNKLKENFYCWLKNIFQKNWELSPGKVNSTKPLPGAI